MYRKFLYMIKQAFYSLVSDDTSAYPQGQATANDKTTTFIRLSVYGVCSNPPKEAHVFLINSQGQEAVKFGILNDFLNRKKSLKEGEVVLYNTITKSFVYLRENGDIEIDCKNNLSATVVGDTSIDTGGNLTATAGGDANVEASGVATIKAPSITLDGNVTITGNLSGSGGGSVNMPNDAEISGVIFSTHVHGGVQTGTSDTGGPK